MAGEEYTGLEMGLGREGVRMLSGGLGGSRRDATSATRDCMSADRPTYRCSVHNRRAVADHKPTPAPGF